MYLDYALSFNPVGTSCDYIFFQLKQTLQENKGYNPKKIRLQSFASDTEDCKESDSLQLLEKQLCAVNHDQFIFPDNE